MLRRCGSRLPRFSPALPIAAICSRTRWRGLPRCLRKHRHVTRPTGFDGRVDILQGSMREVADRPIEIVLPVEGMTCASCVRRIERFLDRTPGVASAEVNLATEEATVRYDPAVVGRTELVAAVEAAGYDVAEVAVAKDGPADASTDDPLANLERSQAAARRDLLVRAVVSLAVAAVALGLTFVRPPGLTSAELNL